MKINIVVLDVFCKTAIAICLLLGPPFLLGRLYYMVMRALNKDIIYWGLSLYDLIPLTCIFLLVPLFRWKGEINKVKSANKKRY
jgi:hypothetical protein